MKEKNIKFVMELIFIFILPLLFICFTSEIHIVRNFTYDNNGNYEISNDTKNFSFDNSVMKFTKIKYYQPIITSEESIYNSGTKTYISQTLNFNNDNGSYYLSQLPLTIHTTGQRLFNGNYLNWYNVYIYINYNTSTEEWSVSSNNSNVNDTMDFYISLHDDVFTINYLSYIIQSGGQLSPVPEEVFNKVITINKDLHKVVNTIWGNFKELLIINFDLNDNLLLDFVLCYTMLWFIMFIIWHLFYTFIDFIVHLARIRKRE